MPKLYSLSSRRLSRLLQHFIAAGLVVAVFLYIGLYTPLFPRLGFDRPRIHIHPIDDLIKDARKTFDELLQKETYTLEKAAKAYRARRGRHPPPGFDQWYHFAKERNAVMIEDFWDQIYEDLNPFWAVEPVLLRTEAANFEMVISVRNGQATTHSDWFWTKIWLDLIKTIEHILPDMDLALNPMDEPRLVVPWEDMEILMRNVAPKRMDKPKDVVNQFQFLPGRKDIGGNVKVQDKGWEDTKPYWPIASRACPPNSLARRSPTQTSFHEPPKISMENAHPHMYKGYISNYTLSTHICHQPDLQGLNGIFIEPLTVSAAKTLFPLFGGSKLTINNEILLPAPMYWNEEERFTGGNWHGGPWSEKNREKAVIWRGTATGGKNRPSNWKGFHRHRFVAMNNGTKINAFENHASDPVNFALPKPEQEYSITALEEGYLGEWVESWSDVGFTDLMCLDDEKDEHGGCSYTSPHFKVVEGLKLSEMYNWRYLPDIDGNSFSGRYLAFLRSSSLPIKATVWREWHDRRLVAWKHFVPMDNRFGDYYGIMDYFLGCVGGVPGHDQEAQEIAADGKRWAERVLRKDDMQIYTLRLLLEYGRVTNDKRDHMGWAGDLL